MIHLIYLLGSVCICLWGQVVAEVVNVIILLLIWQIIRDKLRKEKEKSYDCPNNRKKRVKGSKSWVSKYFLTDRPVVYPFEWFLPGLCSAQHSVLSGITWYSINTTSKWLFTESERKVSTREMNVCCYLYSRRLYTCTLERKDWENRTAECPYLTTQRERERHYYLSLWTYYTCFWLIKYDFLVLFGNQLSDFYTKGLLWKVNLHKLLWQKWDEICCTPKCFVTF